MTSILNSLLKKFLPCSVPRTFLTSSSVRIAAAETFVVETALGAATNKREVCQFQTLTGYHIHPFIIDILPVSPMKKSLLLVRHGGVRIHQKKLIKDKKFQGELIQKPKIFIHNLHSTKPGRFGRLYPILYPHFNRRFDNAAALPDGCTLPVFQIEGVMFLIERNSALLAHEMGSGKSIITIIAVRFLLQKARIGDVLIIAPRNLLHDWQTKLCKWASELNVTTITGDGQARKKLWKMKSHVYLTNYEIITQDATDVRQFDLIVYDEIQRTKNHRTRTHRASAILNAERKWGLSGTPLENSLSELVAVFSILKPGLLQKRRNDQAIKKVTEAIKPYVLRRPKTETMPDLPPIRSRVIWLRLTDGQREVYAEIEKQGIEHLNELGTAIKRGHVLALITRLKLICNLHPATFESCKFNYIIEKVNTIPRRNKILIFSQYPRKVLLELQRRLQQFPHTSALFYGSMPDREKIQIIDQFQRAEEPRVLLMSVRSGALGLTLTRASYVIHVDSWWNPATLDQADGRAHRYGQIRTVHIAYLYTEGTIEEKIRKLIEEKRVLSNAVFKNLRPEDILRKLSVNDLLGLFNVQIDSDEKESRK